MTPVDIRNLTLKNMINATLTDNLSKFVLNCNLVSDLINYTLSQKEEYKTKEYVPK